MYYCNHHHRCEAAAHWVEGARSLRGPDTCGNAAGIQREDAIPQCLCRAQESDNSRASILIIWADEPGRKYENSTSSRHGPIKVFCHMTQVYLNLQNTSKFSGDKFIPAKFKMHVHLAVTAGRDAFCTWNGNNCRPLWDIQQYPSHHRYLLVSSCHPVIFLFSRR